MQKTHISWSAIVDLVLSDTELPIPMDCPIHLARTAAKAHKPFDIDANQISRLLPPISEHQIWVPDSGGAPAPDGQWWERR